MRPIFATSPPPRASPTHSRTAGRRPSNTSLRRPAAASRWWTSITTACSISSWPAARADAAACIATWATTGFATSPTSSASRGRGGRRASAPGTTTTTGTRISSSPIGGRTSSIATSAALDFATSPQTVGLQQDRIRYNTGCAFLDYDRDGRLDLFVANYLKFSFEDTPKPGANPYCWYLGLAVNCGPRGLPFDRNILYHANRDGTFTDVSQPSGVAAPSQSYCLAALVSDFDDDGWPDIFVACDQTPSLLYMNQHDGTFSEEAVLRGAAFNEDGKAMSGMGATAADYEHTGRPGIFRSNFSDERETLYRNRGKAEFDDATVAAGMAHNTRFVGWGCAFFDFDNDGWKDLLLVNGHAFPEVEQKHIDIHFKDRRILYRNLGGGKFEDISERAGPAITAPHSSRGLAVGDIDNDGALEAIVNNQGEPPSLLKQSGKPPGNWVRIELEGTRSNRSAIGARVRLTAGGITQSDEVRSGGSYLSQSDFGLHFGLGGARRVDRVEIRWPNGVTEEKAGLEANRIHKFKEPPR